MLKRICLIVSRIKKDLTQKQIADLVGVSQQIYCKYESGKATPKTFKIMNVISEILGKPKEMLFNDVFDKKGCDDCGYCSSNS